MIQLRGGLVVPGAPAFSAIHGDDRSLVRCQENDVGIVRIYPKVLIIVATRRAAPAVPCFAAISRFPAHDARRVNDLRFFRADPQDGQTPPANSEAWARIISCAMPRLATVIRTIEFPDRRRSN